MPDCRRTTALRRDAECARRERYDEGRRPPSTIARHAGKSSSEAPESGLDWHRPAARSSSAHLVRIRRFMRRSASTLRAAGEVPRREVQARDQVDRVPAGRARAPAPREMPRTAPGPSASRNDCVNRRFVTGRTIRPSSISHTPFRVSPVTTWVRGSRIRVYQKSVTRTPRSTPRDRARRSSGRPAPRTRFAPSAPHAAPPSTAWPVLSTPAALRRPARVEQPASSRRRGRGRAAASACPRRRTGCRACPGR